MWRHVPLKNMYFSIYCTQKVTIIGELVIISMLFSTNNTIHYNYGKLRIFVHNFKQFSSNVCLQPDEISHKKLVFWLICILSVCILVQGGNIVYTVPKGSYLLIFAPCSSYLCYKTIPLDWANIFVKVLTMLNNFFSFNVYIASKHVVNSTK